MATEAERPRRVRSVLVLSSILSVMFTCPASASVCSTRTALGIIRFLSVRRENHCKRLFAKSSVEESKCPNAAFQPTCCSSSDCPGDSVCDCFAGCDRPICLFRLSSGARSHLCPPLIPPDNSRLTSGSEPYTAAIHCNKGYFLKGAASLLCGRFNQWIRPKKEPKCLRITCRQPTLPHGMSFASKLRSHYTSGDGLRIKCTKGFVFRVNKRKGRKGVKWRQMRSLRCRKSGRWSPRNPTCYPQKRCCAKPQSPANGSITYSSAAQSFCMGESATVSCNKCFRYVGKSQHVCTNPSESLSLADAHCQEIRCAMPNLPFQAFIANSSKHSAHFSCDSSLKISCLDDPRQLLGPTTITCNEDGSWSGPLPKCTAPTKPKKVKAMARTNTTVRLKWRPPLAGSRSVTLYKVKYFAKTADSIPLRQVVLTENVSGLEVKKGWYRYTVAGLRPYTEYCFFVAAISGNNIGAESNELRTTTKAGVPSVPRDLQAIEKAKSRSSLPSLFLSWLAPTQLNGPVKYVVRINTRHRVAPPYIKEKRFAATSALTMYVKSLQPFTEYNVSVMATTGASRYSSSVSTTATLTSRLFRPRAPQRPEIILGPPAVLLIHASEDYPPFVQTYEVHVSRVPRSKNSLEDGGISIDETAKLDYIAARFPAEDFENSASKNRTKRLVLGDTSLYENNHPLEPGRTYVFHTRIRSPADTKSWSEKTEYTPHVQDNNYFSSR